MRGMIQVPMIGLLLLLLMVSGCTFGKHTLPEDFQVRAIGTYRWSPIPFAEADVYYDFIGIGWLMHDQRSDEVHLDYQGQNVACAKHMGDDGWKFTSNGQKLIARRGWCCGGYADTSLVGMAPRADAAESQKRSPKKHFAPGTPHLNDSNETNYLQEWQVMAEPLQKLDEKWNTTVFLIDINNHSYTRLVGYNAAHYKWLGAAIKSAGDELPGGYYVHFQFQDCRTGEILQGQYPHRWRETGQVQLLKTR